MKLSILIPNFNNGPESSHSRNFDLIGECLESLDCTLPADESVEIVIADDASTDSSPEIIQSWVDSCPKSREVKYMRFSSNQGLCRTTNRMVRAASGDILMRLDADAAILSPGFDRVIKRLFTEKPNMGILGPLQLIPDGLVHAFGDFITHPKGDHHIGFRQPVEKFRKSPPVRCDHTMGALYVFRRELFDIIGGFDPEIFRADCIDFTIRSLISGWETWVTPEISFVHFHRLRQKRPCAMDDARNIAHDIEYLKEKHGFHWQKAHKVPGLAEIFRRYHNTGLCWNPEVFKEGAA